MKKILVNSNECTQLYFDDGLLQSQILLDALAHYDKPIALIADETVFRHHAKHLKQRMLDEGIKVEHFTFVPGEPSKVREVKEVLEDQMFDAGFSRDTIILAVGGGVTLDLAGFIAATFCRGVPLILCPTTLLAMVDVAIGGKTGVNTQHGKNLIGNFYFPDYVFVDPTTLATLDDAEFKNGWVELIKHILLSEKYTPLPPPTRETELNELLFKSLEFKQSIVEADAYETSGLRSILNFGHTFGHALEAACNYQLPHGYAVAWGILSELKISSELDFFPVEQFYEIQAYFEKHGLLKRFSYFDRYTFVRTLLYDKKGRDKRPRFILLRRRGEVYQKERRISHEVDQNVVESTIQWMIGKGTC